MGGDSSNRKSGAAGAVVVAAAVLAVSAAPGMAAVQGQSPAVTGISSGQQPSRRDEDCREDVGRYTPIFLM